MRVGVPRAMLFHHYGDRWLEFLDEIGAETLVSEETSSATIAAGAGIADNETCLPVKVFSGHVMSLKDRTDAILVPRVLSEEAGTCSCPKFLGLPDLARSLDPGLQPVVAPRMDIGWSRWMWAREWYRAARDLGATRASASRAAARMLRRLEELRAESAVADRGQRDISIGVAGHLYNVHDERASLGLLDRLRGMGVRPVTVDEVDPGDAFRQAASLPRRVFWGFEERLAGAVLHWSRTRAVSGILFVTSFACGPGSIVGALLEDQLSSEGSVPLMTITLDEHAAEAGLVTRLEAFVDMLRHAAAREARR
jgi:predicted nucleotide-binding protein (sugar kinase/HSP70/actin superfamily)